MNLKINGDLVEVPNDLKTVSDLLAHFNLQERVVIIEHNQDIIAKENHHIATLSDGDQIEIVHFVGGG
ncbi:sulfur carrier protein ThiS [Bacillus salitolerans]|uniref:Sulfur carrier protein ThiS n=1 Tax=Bacillus salitolerans TaxID=1437434 RepID=A0ABW4LV95_9BACI